MSMYADYIKEREGMEIMEDDRGFCSYLFADTACYIKDVYVKPEYRAQGVWKEYADTITLIAKAYGYKVLQGSVDKRTRGADRSKAMLESYGMKYFTSVNGIDYYEKEI